MEPTPKTLPATLRLAHKLRGAKPQVHSAARHYFNVPHLPGLPAQELNHNSSNQQLSSLHQTELCIARPTPPVQVSHLVKCPLPWHVSLQAGPPLHILNQRRQPCIFKHGGVQVAPAWCPLKLDASWGSPLVGVIKPCPASPRP